LENNRRDDSRFDRSAAGPYRARRQYAAGSAQRVRGQSTGHPRIMKVVSVEFHLFGPAHLVILASVPSVAWVLTGLARHRPARARRLAAALGIVLAVNELVWYVYVVHSEGFRFPDGLPLELCDLILWLTVAALLTLRPLIFEFAYLIGVAGSGAAILTPDLGVPLDTYAGINFFVTHGAVVASLLFLVWSGIARPRPGCIWRALGLLNAYAAAIGGFDALFRTNYMYLCRKPESISILDLFGPWPIYIAGGEALALMLFWLLWLPFRSKSRTER